MKIERNIKITEEIASEEHVIELDGETIEIGLEGSIVVRFSEDEFAEYMDLMRAFEKELEKKNGA